MAPLAAAIPYIVAAAAVAGTAIAYSSAQAQAESSKNAAEYNAQVAANNAKAAMDQADHNARLQQIQAGKTIGAMEAKYGASGVDMSGSALDALGNSASSAELDRQTILYKGRVQAAGYRSEVDLDNARGTNAIKQGNEEGAAAILSGAGKLAGQYGNNLSGSGNTMTYGQAVNTLNAGAQGD